VCSLVSYDGTDFHGFQYQSNTATIQGALEDALLALTKSKVRVVGAGRTDAGVHASGQVVSAQVPWRHSIADLKRAWNAHLPTEITILKAEPAPEQFHPRFSAGNRTYRYTVYFTPSAATGQVVKRMPLLERFALYDARPLDVIAMQKAASFLVGEYDFATFGQPPQGNNTYRRVFQSQWQVVTTNLLPVSFEPIQQVVFTITANAFLRNMVRNVVGSLLKVGRGDWQVEEMLAALHARDRGRSAPPAPPNGLVLEAVHYPQYPGLLKL